MSTSQNDRLCATLSVVAVLFVKLGVWMTSGELEFNAIGDGITLILVVWLASGSMVARWIVGALTSIAVIITIGGAVWLAVGSYDLRLLGFRQQLAWVPMILSTCVNAFVAWRLIIWNRRLKRNNNEAEQVMHVNRP